MGLFLEKRPSVCVGMFEMTKMLCCIRNCHWPVWGKDGGRRGTSLLGADVCAGVKRERGETLVSAPDMRFKVCSPPSWAGLLCVNPWLLAGSSVLGGCRPFEA